MRRRLLVVLAVVMVAAAGCGKSSDDQDPPPRDQGVDGGAEGSALDLKATDFAFAPETLEVEPGAEVEVAFVNGGSAAHTFTAEDLGVDVEAAGGEETTATFTAPDEDTTVTFVCRFHSDQMKGTITVGSGASGAGGSGDSSGDESAEDYDY